MEHPYFPPRFLRVITLLVAAMLCGCKETGGTARDAAEEMSRAFSGQRIAEAYRKTATAFRFTRSESYFEARVRDLGLCDARSVEWGAPEQNGRLATVRGEFTLKDESRLALNFTFSMEEGGWRLIEARSAPARGGTAEDVFAVASRTKDTVSARALDILEPTANDLPPDPQLRQLAEDTLMIFNECLRNGGDFSPLYSAASDRWKYRGRDPHDLAYVGSDPERLAALDPLNNDNRLTTGALKRAFAAAVDARVDLSPIRGKKMLLAESPRVNSDGVLTLRGTFDAAVFQATMPDRPRKVDFMLEYVRESGRWKLFGITVNIIAADKESAEKP
jgi:hypothetical protein